MARYKWIDTSPRFLAVDLAKQMLPGSFEHAVHHLFEHEIDLSGFAARYHNIRTGRRLTRPGCWRRRNHRALTRSQSPTQGRSTAEALV
ncbi:hypothetical protein [Azovibrio restrictus]|uniref:hypothetical protein n=1 Tax=Azovibrio restrictus TaxID=146938 RepID=UPI0026E91E12|nr:hypothetical protein [Azovibrio restrictus]MDD3483568.1 hypothetical protein [Azovibrio restrictus]